ncbi:neuronal acetylcholine receptor subunit alpha-10-like [Patiria miniata]|uniref:Uncharacterized protein n=1 Tax=Patiria miniata TaxID=46514 RepID=A0A914A482_PATMI|nr:neuronal acetylcholine receptor subunit alpha-10-like [Patiria miniata]
MADMRIVLIWIGSMLVLHSESSREPSNQNRLLKELLDNYGYTTVRPVYNLSHPTTVELRLTIVQVIELNERHQTIEIGAWLTQRWTDEYMRWEPADYGGVDHLYVHKSLIWLPDVTMYKNVDRDFESYKDISAKVSHTGLVNWATPVILKCTCTIDARLFPFDTQVCQIRFSSWALDSRELNLTEIKEDSRKNFYTDVGVWELLDVVVEREEVSYDDGTTYVDLSHFIHLRRRPLYHLLQIILPCLLLSLLNLMVFILPPQSGEKISLGVTNLLSLILFQQLISGNLPPTANNAPIIGFYFTPMIALSCTSIVCTVAVLGLFYRDNRRPIPRWVVYIVFGILSRLVCHRTSGEIAPTISKSRRGESSLTREPENVESTYDLTDLSGNLTENVRESSPAKSLLRQAGDWDETRCRPYDATKQLCTVSHSKTHDSPVMRARKRVCDGESETRLKRHQTRPLPSSHTWREVAVVIDRTALMLSLLITLCSIVTCVVSFIISFHSE